MTECIPKTPTLLRKELDGSVSEINKEELKIYQKRSENTKIIYLPKNIIEI